MRLTASGTMEEAMRLERRKKAQGDTHGTKLEGREVHKELRRLLKRVRGPEKRAVS